MIEKIIAWSVQKRWTVVFLTLLASLWGGWSFLHLPIDAVPDITNNQVQVNATAQGFIPEELEKKLTYPLEIAMGGIPGVQEVRSLTKFGLSQVTVVFNDGTDIYRNRQLVTERLQNLTDLPPGVNPPSLSPISSGLGEIFHFAVQVNIDGVTDSTQALMQAKELQEWVIKPRILTVPGVAEVNTIGGYTRQIQVQPHLLKLAEYRLNLSDLKTNLLKANHNAGGGYIRDQNRQLLIQASGQFQSLDDIRNLPVKTLQNLKTVKLGEVADVQFAPATRTGAGLLNGKESVLGTVMMLSGANSRTVAKAVAERVEELKQGNELPKNVKLTTLYDRSDLVDETLETVIHNLWVGAILVIVVLFLLLGNFKAALTVSLSIPVTLLTTFGFMKWLGISGNLMSLGALDFGIIVDGAVIVVDHCVSWIQDPKKKGNVLSKVSLASTEIRSAAGFGQIMVIVVFLPIIGLGGIEGKMFRPMAETFAIALAISLLLSFTLIPALAAILFTENESAQEPKLMKKIQQGYTPLLKKALQWHWPVLGISLILLIIAGFLFTRLGAEFLPRLDEGSLVLQMVRPVDTSLEASIHTQSRAEQEILKFGAVEGVFSRIGTPEVATDPMGPNEADTFVLLKKRADWNDSGVHYTSKEKMIEALMKKVNDVVPDQELSATQPIQMRFNDLLEGTRADLTIKVYGEKLEELNQLTHDIVKVVKDVPGSGDIQAEFRGEIPLLEISPKTEVLSKFSLSSSPVSEAISIGMAGENAGYYYEGLRKIPIFVKLNEQVRNDPATLRKMQIFVADNLTMPLEDLAHIESRKVMSPILRENSKRRSAVLINPRGRDVQSFVEDAQKKIAAEIRVPVGNRLEWFGSFKNLNEAKTRLAILGPIALLLVAAMIYWAFGNIVETLIVLATVPLAWIGGILGLTLASIPFSISAAVGFIALSGIAVLNGVVLVHYFNELRSKAEFRGLRWVTEGARLRLRAVLMTALVDIFGFIPMSVSVGVGSEVQKPLAVVVIGGVITSTLLTLIVLPVLSSLVLRRGLSASD